MLKITAKEFDQILTKKFKTITDLADHVGIDQSLVRRYVLEGFVGAHNHKVLIAHALCVDYKDLWTLDLIDGATDPVNPIHDPEAFGIIYRSLHPSANAFHVYFAFLTAKGSA